jgi:hypothetical protein
MVDEFFRLANENRQKEERERFARYGTTEEEREDWFLYYEDV